MERYAFALTCGDRFEYEPRNGWNLELTYDEDGEVKALYRLVKIGSHASLEPTPDDSLEVNHGKYTAYKIACDLKEARFVLNPNEDNTHWREYEAFTLEELRFHMQRLRFQLPPAADWMLKTMREGKETVHVQIEDLRHEEKRIWTGVLERAGIKPEVFISEFSSRSFSEELVRGYFIRRLWTRLQSNQFLRIFQILQAGQDEYPETPFYTKTEGTEFMETWQIKNPAKILFPETNLSHSALSLCRYHMTIPVMNFVVAVAKPYPMPEIFRPLEEQASFVKHQKSFKPSVEEVVFGI